MKRRVCIKKGFWPFKLKNDYSSVCDKDSLLDMKKGK